MEASKFSPSDRESPDWTSPEPLKRNVEVLYSAARPPQPFWGRVARAVGLLSIAIAAHVWLVRAPRAPTAADAAGPAGATSLSARGRVERWPAPAATDGVRIVSELVPVGTSRILVDPDPVSRSAHASFGAPPPASRASTDMPPRLRDDGAAKRTDETAALGRGTGGPSDTTGAPINPAASSLTALPLTRVVSPGSLLQQPSAHLSLSGVGTPPTALTARRAEPPAEPDRQRVKQLLDEYVAAFERLDVEAAKAVYPSVDDKALRRAFQQLEAQRLTFQSCGITIDGSDANARCEGQASYRPRIGSRTLRISPREWTFNLSKADAGWQIVDARVVR